MWTEKKNLPHSPFQLGGKFFFYHYICLTFLSSPKYPRSIIIDFLDRHSGKDRAQSEVFNASQVDSRSWFSGCRIKSGMTENFRLSRYKLKYGIIHGITSTKISSK
jgi:hypothetical protein